MVRWVIVVLSDIVASTSPQMVVDAANDLIAAALMASTTELARLRLN